MSLWLKWFLIPSALVSLPKHQTARSGGGPAKDAAGGSVPDNRGASGLPAPRVGGEQQVSHDDVERYIVYPSNPPWE